MKEIGGYFEFETFHGEMLHEDGIKLDCGRSCLAYLIKAKRISHIYAPKFLCDAVFNLFRSYSVKTNLYEVGYDLKPKNLDIISKDSFLLLVNYYGQLSSDDIIQYKESYPNVIIDNTQAYFSDPVKTVDTLYTCRKFFGVPDGGILYTTTTLDEDINQSESFQHMEYILGRFERNATEFYKQSVFNNDRFSGKPILKMSKITENMLHGFDYTYIQRKREENFFYLHQKLKTVNKLNVSKAAGPFSYPLLLDNGEKIRRKLQKEKIYIPVLWPNVLSDNPVLSTAYDLAANILPIPCDQRYGISEMNYICDLIR